MPLQKRPRNWVTAATSTYLATSRHAFTQVKYFVVGDVHGQISLICDGDVVAKKVVHGAAITCLVADSTAGTIFSASRDGTIKVWRGRGLKQVKWQDNFDWLKCFHS